MDKNKKIGWFSTITGTIAFTLGILGLICATPVCGTLCIGGLLAVLSGIGVMAFLHKYHVIFLLLGICIFILGIVLIARYRKKCLCPRE